MEAPYPLKKALEESLQYLGASTGQRPGPAIGDPNFHSPPGGIRWGLSIVPSLQIVSFRQMFYRDSCHMLNNLR